MEIPTEFLSGLIDKGPVIGMLLISVIYFYKRCNKLEDKIDKITGDDRKEMIETLQKNTKALEDFIESR